MSMKETALVVKQFDAEIKKALNESHSRTGLFRDSDGQYYVKANLPLGMKYTDEVIGIFADEIDLKFYYKLYLGED